MLKTFNLVRSATLFVAGLALTLAGMAQSLSGLTVEPASGKAGGSVKATVNFDVHSGTNCGMRLHWGDGSVDNFKVNQRKDVPWITSHSYAKAGSYEIMAEPKTQGLVPRCGGDNRRATVTVTAAAAPIAAAASAAAKTPARPASVPKAVVTASASAASPCPAGWRLGASGIDAKTKAFTCLAAPNSKLPVKRLSCPGELDYFENAKRGELGCRP